VPLSPGSRDVAPDKREPARLHHQNCPVDRADSLVRPAFEPVSRVAIEWVAAADDELAAIGSVEFGLARLLGGTIAAITAPGSGRPVLLLHGNSSTKRVWSRQIAALTAAGRPVLAPDLPGHGDSANAAVPHATYSMPGYAAVMMALLDAMRWDEVDVIGWSLGGHIGLELLATEPRVRSLLIVGTPPGRPCAESLAAAFLSSERMDLASKAGFSAADALAYGSAMMGGEARLTPELFAQVLRTDGQARACVFDSVLRGIGTDQRATVESSAKPLCVIHGALEPFVRLDYLRSLKYRALWNNSIYVIANVGHAPHWERPTTFNRLLLDFLAH
jgi:pimeloyl-ACP methyl ester carboxylesterase